MASRIHIRVIVADTASTERAIARLGEVARRDAWPPERVFRVARRLARQFVARARFVTMAAVEARR